MEFEPVKEEEKVEKKSSVKSIVDEYNGTYYLTPKDPVSVEAFLSIDRQTKAAVGQRFGIRTRNDWECFTIACNYLKALVTVTMDESKKNFGKQASLMFYDMLIVSSSFYQNMSAEKTGSLNVVVEPGEAADRIITDADGFWEYDKIDPREFFFPEDGFADNSGMDIEIMKKIDNVVRLVCYKKHKITIPDKYIGLVTAIAYTFFEKAFGCVAAMVRRSENPMNTERIIMGEYADINGFVTADDNIRITIIPGAISKRTAKDDMTERDEFSVE